MTLIIAAITPQYAALISDRRITHYTRRPQDGKPQKTGHEDADTKTIILAGRYVMGISGMGRVRGQRMETWLAQALVGVDAGDYFEAIAEKLQPEIDQSPYLGATAFLAAGYSSEDEEPELVTVSNAFDGDDKYRPEIWGAGRTNLKVQRTRLAGAKWAVDSVGFKMPEESLSWLRRQVHRQVRAYPLQPAKLIDAFKGALYRTAEQSSELVGKACLFTPLPRVVVPLEIVRLYPFQPSLDESLRLDDMRIRETTLYIPDPDYGGQLEWYDPAIVAPYGMAVNSRLEWSSPNKSQPTEIYKGGDLKVEVYTVDDDGNETLLEPGPK